MLALPCSSRALRPSPFALLPRPSAPCSLRIHRGTGRRCHPPPCLRGPGYSLRLNCELAAAQLSNSFLAGAIAGAIDTCITMPLDTIKTQMQLSKGMGASMVGCAKTIVQTDGPAGLYKGFAPFVVQASGKAAVRFFCYDSLCKTVDTFGIDRSKNAALWSLTCGTGAGMVEALGWTCPSERLKVLQQSTAGTGGKVPSYMEVLKVQGIRGLYVGAIPTAGRQATSVAVRFTMVDQVKGVRLCKNAFRSHTTTFGL